MLPQTSSNKKSPFNDEEETKSFTQQLSNRNVEEVLQNIRDADDEDEIFERQEELESEEEKEQTPAPNEEQDDETLAVNLMSPAS